MTTMSDEGDRTCPLCAEDMDITDQQLKPCKCGYEICVWCWHHIMEMAEKEETEGRCPACRTPYDKDRIVKMAANCERMVAEINAEKRHKAQKSRPKTSADARKHLTSVRVIQRNLVYIIGLPNTLCDETLLERREYFGQYGKVMKVSISKPTGAAAQQATANNTFSVYITYSKEEEAIRCIQSVHNFILEGKSLRACFGTTKYCHSWLRNLSCNNPDCLYLHDIGNQEDSFTKDEIISAYTRSRVPQLVYSNTQRRAGNFLPPPADDFSISSSGGSTSIPAKQPIKDGTNNVPVTQAVSPPNSSAGKSTLPAAASWGLRNVSSKPAPTSVTSSSSSSQTLAKPKVDAPNLNSNLNSNPLLNPSTLCTSLKQNSAWNDDPLSSSSDIISESKRLNKSGTGKELEIDLTDIPSAWNDDPIFTPKSTVPPLSQNQNQSQSQRQSQSQNPSCEVSTSGGLSSPPSPSPLILKEREETTLPVDTRTDLHTQNLSAGLSSLCLDSNDLADVSNHWTDVGNTSTILSNGHHNHIHNDEREEQNRKNSTASVYNNFEGVNVNTEEESSIISNILSLDFDPWDDSSLSNFWTTNSSNNLNTNNNNSNNTTNKNASEKQSRFSFARQGGQEGLLETSRSSEQRYSSLMSQSLYENGFGLHFSEGPSAFTRSMSRSKVSAPPGFSLPSRIVPPGFSSQDRSNHSFDSTIFSENQYQSRLTGNSADIEFMDPAILAVGKGLNDPTVPTLPTIPTVPTVPVSSYPRQFSPSNTDPRIQLLMQQALNDNISNHNNNNNNFSNGIGNNYNPARYTPVQQQRGAQWDPFHSLGVSEILRNERVMMGNLYSNSANDESSFHIPGDLYNRAFGL